MRPASALHKPQRSRLIQIRHPLQQAALHLLTAMHQVFAQSHVLPLQAARPAVWLPATALGSKPLLVMPALVLPPRTVSTSLTG